MGGLPKANGHIFFIGRDMTDKRTLNVCASNIPRQTWFDKFRAWEGVNNQLPKSWQTDAKQWKKTLFACMTRKEAYQQVDGADEVPDTKEVYLLRKKLTGLVIGPLDKNNGELWACCPVLYHQALEKNYSQQAGYEEVHTAKLSAYRKRRYSIEELPEQILRTTPAPANQRGDAKDIVELFQRIYKRRGWDKYAKFNRQGGPQTPYVLFKSKNVTDPQIRESKLMKARPIAPGTRHPMRKLLHYVGRAWSFITARMPGEHFAINKCAEVPKFLEQAGRELSHLGTLKAEIWDVEGAYPNCPKPTIRFAMRKVVRDIRASRDETYGVFVPKYSDAQLCMFETRIEARIPVHTVPSDARRRRVLTRFHDAQDARRAYFEAN